MWGQSANHGKVIGNVFKKFEKVRSYTDIIKLMHHYRTITEFFRSAI